MGYFNFSDMVGNVSVNGQYDTIRDMLRIDVAFNDGEDVWYTLMDYVNVEVSPPDIGFGDDVSSHMDAVAKLIRLGNEFRNQADVKFSMVNVFDDSYEIRVWDMNRKMGDVVIVDTIRLINDGDIQRIVEGYRRAFYMDM